MEREEIKPEVYNDRRERERKSERERERFGERRKET